MILFMLFVCGITAHKLVKIHLVTVKIRPLHAGISYLASDLYTAAANAVENAHLVGNACYGVYNVAKQAEKDCIKKYIKVFGSEGKAWTKEKEAFVAVETTNVEKA